MEKWVTVKEYWIMAQHLLQFIEENQASSVDVASHDMLKQGVEYGHPVIPPYANLSLDLSPRSQELLDVQ